MFLCLAPNWSLSFHDRGRTTLILKSPGLYPSFSPTIEARLRLRLRPRLILTYRDIILPDPPVIDSKNNCIKDILAKPLNSSQTGLPSLRACLDRTFQKIIDRGALLVSGLGSENQGTEERSKERVVEANARRQDRGLRLQVPSTTVPYLELISACLDCLIGSCLVGSLLVTA